MANGVDWRLALTAWTIAVVVGFVGFAYSETMVTFASGFALGLIFPYIFD